MAIRYLFICASLFCFACAKAQEVPKPILPVPVYSLPVEPVKITPTPRKNTHPHPHTLFLPQTQQNSASHLAHPKLQMDIPEPVQQPVIDIPVQGLNKEQMAAFVLANAYLAKIRKILSTEDFLVYQKKEAELVPAGNPFGLLKIREKYYKIFADYKQ